MELTYVKIYKDFIDIVRALDNGARGRLFMAIMQYMNDEEVDNLTGGENIAFLTIKSQIDRDAASYDNLSAVRAKSGAKGAEKRWAKQSKSIANAKVAILPYSKNSNCYQDKDQDKDYRYDDEDDAREDDFMIVAETQDPGLVIITEAFETSIGTISGNISEQIREWRAKVEPEMIVAAIKEADNNNKRSWSYVKKMLENAQGKGVTTLSSWDAAKADFERQKQEKTQLPKKKKVAADLSDIFGGQDDAR